MLQYNSVNDVLLNMVTICNNVGHALELLADKIWKDKQISGIKIQRENLYVKCYLSCW